MGAGGGGEAGGQWVGGGVGGGRGAWRRTEFWSRGGRKAPLGRNPGTGVAVAALQGESLAREDPPPVGKGLQSGLARQRRIPLVTRALLASAQ